MKFLCSTILFCLVLSVPTIAQTKTRVYIEHKVGQTPLNVTCAYGNCNTGGGKTVDFSAKATDALMSQCPESVTVTADSDAADFMLRLQTGASVLFNKAGDAVYVSHEKRKLSRFAKDICGYIKTVQH
jgi:hypothetical protein